MEKHEELDTIKIDFDCAISRQEVEVVEMEDLLLTVFSHLNLRYITFNNMMSTGDIFSCLPSTLPSLEKLKLSNWVSLSAQGLVEILNRSRSNLRKLDLSDSSITGVGVEEGVNSLPNIEVVKLYSCYNLTDGGLKEILRLSRCTLRVLNVSFTHITGQGFQEGVSLPMLEELYLYGCSQLTDSGLLEILSSTGRRLKTVNIGLCRNLSTVFRRCTLLNLYPFVYFK